MSHLTVVAAITFFAATVGINLVANFIPPAYDIANLAPARSAPGPVASSLPPSPFHRRAVGGLHQRSGHRRLCRYAGAALAPLYGIIVADYYLVRRQHLDLQQLFSTERSGIYHFNAGWNRRR